MSSTFRDALRALNQLKADGVVDDYAVAGAMALMFWTEPVPTFDLDVLVFLPGETGPLISLDPIYRWAAAQGYPTDAEHVIVQGVPTQFLPAPDPLADEAIRGAAEVDYEGLTVRVVRPVPRSMRFWSAMASRSEPRGDRPRPTPELLRRLFQGKAALRAQRASLPLRQKVAQLLELQRLQYPLLKRQRTLSAWERPWEIEP
jgi:hypothetical protein